MKSGVLKRVGRYAAVIFAALAVTQAVRVGQGMSREIELVLSVPTGLTAVTIRTESGDFVRRTEFSGPPTVLSLKLPDGSYFATIAPEGRKEIIRSFVVAGDNRIKVAY